MQMPFSNSERWRFDHIFKQPELYTHDTIRAVELQL